jgi:hypothetical protein
LKILRNEPIPKSLKPTTVIVAALTKVKVRQGADETAERTAPFQQGTAAPDGMPGSKSLVFIRPVLAGFEMTGDKTAPEYLICNGSATINAQPF